MQIVFKNKTILSNNFHFKDRILKDLTSGVVYKFQCGLCNESYYGECVRHLTVRLCSTYWFITTYQKRIKSKNSSLGNHLLFCNHSASYDDFNILTLENKKLLLEVKESLLIMRNKPTFNMNITSAPLYLFSRP